MLEPAPAAEIFQFAGREAAAVVPIVKFSVTGVVLAMLICECPVKENNNKNAKLQNDKASDLLKSKMFFINN